MFGMHTALADPVAVIVNSANTQNLSLEDVKNIYADKLIAWKMAEGLRCITSRQKKKLLESFARQKCLECQQVTRQQRNPIVLFPT